MSSSHASPETLRTARRRLAAVLVEGLDAVGARVAEHLIDSGIGTVLIRDDQPATTADPYCSAADQGRPRAEVLCRRLRRSPSTSAILEAPAGSTVPGLDLHILVTTGAADVTRLRQAAAGSAAVLPVELSSAGLCIGPMLGGAAAMCPDCLVLHGLTEVQHSQDSHPAATAGSLELIAAGAAIQQTQLLIDGEPAAASSAALLLDSRTGRLSHRAAAAHPECQCLTVTRESAVGPARSQAPG